MQTEDIIVLILATAVSFALVATAVTPWILKQPIGEERSKVIASLVMAIIAIISLYIGAKLE